MGEKFSVDGVHMHLENKKISKNFFWMLWVMYAVVYMTKSCYSAAMASIVDEGILTKSQTGLINAVFYGVYAPFQILGGVFADKYNPEKMIKIGLVGAGIANAIIFFNQNYYVMLFTWVFNAVVQFALWPSVFKIVSSQLETEYKVKGVYFITFSSTFGLILAYLVAAVVPMWQYNFMVSAVSLFLLAVMFHFVCNHVAKYMVPDDRQGSGKDKLPLRQSDKTQISTWKLFLFSGFFILIFVTALRTIVSNGIQTLSATMLMESYEQISPTIGNLLNVLVIIAGILGLIIVNVFIYPRLIHNEVVAILILLCIAVVPVSIMATIGRVTSLVIIVSLCVASAILSGLNLLMSRCSAAFAKHGKNGLASGVNNAFSSVGFMIQNYAVVVLADRAGWDAVIYLWIGLLGISVLCVVVTLPLWSKFRSNK